MENSRFEIVDIVTPEVSVEESRSWMPNELGHRAVVVSHQLFVRRFWVGIMGLTGCHSSLKKREKRNTPHRHPRGLLQIDEQDDQGRERCVHLAFQCRHTMYGGDPGTRNRNNFVTLGVLFTPMWGSHIAGNTAWNPLEFCTRGRRCSTADSRDLKNDHALEGYGGRVLL